MNTSVVLVTSCKDKALFLLKFSGLTRIASSGDVSLLQFVPCVRFYEKFE